MGVPAGDLKGDLTTPMGLYLSSLSLQPPSPPILPIPRGLGAPSRIKFKLLWQITFISPDLSAPGGRNLSATRAALALLLSASLAPPPPSPTPAAQGVLSVSGGGIGLELTPSGAASRVTVSGSEVEATGSPVLVLGRPESTGNLLANPGFEAPGGGGGPEGWELYGGASIDRSEVHGGGASLRLEGPGSGSEGPSAYYARPIPARPGDVCKLDVWMRREGISCPDPYCATVRVFGSGSRGEAWWQVSAGSLGNGTSGWRRYVAYFFVPPGTSSLGVYAEFCCGDGTVWVDDVSLRCTSVRWTEAPTSASRGEGGEVVVEASSDLRASLTLSGGEFLRARLEVSADEDVPAAVAVCLPVRLSGWTWWHDPWSGERVEPGSLVWTPEAQGRAVTTPYGVSVYPLAALSPPGGGPGVALGVDPRRPTIFRVEYVPGMGLCSVHYLAVGPGLGVALDLAAFSFDGGSGLRGALSEYYRAFGVTGGPLEPGGMVMDFWDQEDELLERFASAGFRYVLTPPPHRLALLDELGMVGVGYTCPWIVGRDYTGTPEPNVTRFLEDLRRDAEEGGPNFPSPGPGWYIIPEEDKALVARATLNSLPHDDRGADEGAFTYQWSYLWSEWLWGDLGWRRNYFFPVNPLPQVPGPNRFDTVVDEVEYHVARGAASLLVDSADLFVDLIDFREEHLEALRGSGVPLSFEPGTGRPGLPYALVVAYTLRALRDRFAPENLTLMADLFSYAPLSLGGGFVDLPYHECVCGDDLYGYELDKLWQERAVAGPRPAGVWMAHVLDPSVPRRAKLEALNRSLFFGLLPMVPLELADREELEWFLGVLDRRGNLLRALTSATWDPSVRVDVDGPARAETFRVGRGVLITVLGTGP